MTVNETLKQKLAILKKETFRMSGFEKRFIKGLENLNALTPKQALWLDDLWSRIEKQKLYRKAESGEVRV